MDIQENNSVFSGKSLDVIEDIMRNSNNGDVSFINMDVNKDFEKQSHADPYARSDKNMKANEQYRHTNANIQGMN